MPTRNSITPQVRSHKLVFGCMLCKRGLAHAHVETPIPVNKARTLATLKAIHATFFAHTRNPWYTIRNSPLKNT